jgi:hypothetical protein
MAGRIFDAGPASSSAENALGDWRLARGGLCLRRGFQPRQERAMPKGQQHGREKKKPKKDKASKPQSTYASEYGKQQPSHIVESTTGKKQ